MTADGLAPESLVRDRAIEVSRREQDAREIAVLSDFWCGVAAIEERIESHISALPAEIRQRLLGGAR